MSVVEARANPHNIEDGFEHHAMSCTLESGVGCAMGNGVPRFGSLDQVFDNDDLRSFDQGIEWIDQSKRGSKE